ncbi:MAG: PAS domain S-box protein [Nitrospirae bacterium]|nr:PAS domain S-box protein [Nitrospirota bacterium]
MKISKKAAIVMVLVAVLPVCVISIATYHIAKAAITYYVYKELESVANVQKDRIENDISLKKSILDLITSRPPMRVALERYMKTGEKSQQNVVLVVLSNAKEAVKNIRDIFILDMDGKVVASTNTSLDGKDMSGEDYFTKGRTGYSLDVFSLINNEVVRYLSCPLLHEGRQIGVLVLEITTTALHSITANYDGLGKTGETTIARRDKNGDGLFITPLRFDLEAALRKRIPSKDTEIVMTQALLKKEHTFYDSLDYRGKHVIATTRYIKELDWGMVLKIDKDEAFAPLLYLRKLYIMLTLIVMIFVIVVSQFISRSITSPIIRLTSVARRIRNGDVYQMPAITSKDEIFFLSSTFDEMTRSLLDSKTRLAEEVQEHIHLEKQNKTILSTSIDGFLIVDTERMILQTNMAYCNMIGYTEEELLRMGISDIETLEPPEVVQKRIRKIIGTGGNRFESKHRCKNGSFIDVEISVNFIKSDNVIFAFIRDITERKRMEEEIRMMNETLQGRVEQEVAKNQIKDRLMFEQARHVSMGELLVNIAHHWRQPLCGVALSVQDIKDAYLHGELDEAYLNKNIGLALSELKMLSDTINNFKKFYITGKEQREFNISDEINKANTLISGYVKEKDIVIDKELDESLTIQGFPNEFAQIILNILTNVKDKFEQKKVTHGTIKIRLYKDDTTGRKIITITDNGGGIPDDIIDKVFDPYFTTKDKSRGTGMGLYMAKVIIEKNMNGTISVRNIDGWCELRIEI